MSTHRLFSHIVNTVRTAMVVTCEKLVCKGKVEIGLGFGDEICVSRDDRAGLIPRQTVLIGCLDEVGSNEDGNETRTEIHCRLCGHLKSDGDFSRKRGIGAILLQNLVACA